MKQLIQLFYVNKFKQNYGNNSQSIHKTRDYYIQSTILIKIINTILYHDIMISVNMW